jgi:hypothetical protein
MARNNLLNTRTTNLLELVGNGRIYRVARYQRNYSWEVEQWEDLWSDLLELRGRPDDRHYMGALVVEGKSDREFLIIDGQQRLATLSLLALAVIAKLREMADRGADPEANQERAARLRSRFIGEKDPASLIESSKLFLNETDDGFYQDYLVQLRRPLNPKGLTKSNRLLWECFSYYQESIESVPGFATDGAALDGPIGGRVLGVVALAVDDVVLHRGQDAALVRALGAEGPERLRPGQHVRVVRPGGLRGGLLEQRL